jgi:hypothetical protein
MSVLTDKEWAQGARAIAAGMTCRGHMPMRALGVDDLVFAPGLWPSWGEDHYVPAFRHAYARSALLDDVREALGEPTLHTHLRIEAVSPGYGVALWWLSYVRAATDADSHYGSVLVAHSGGYDSEIDLLIDALEGAKS